MMTEVEDEVETTAVEQEEAFDLEDNRQLEPEPEGAVEAEPQTEAVPTTATTEATPTDTRTLWQQSTIQISIHLLPVDGQPGGRPVMLGLRAGQGAPVIHQLREVDLGRLPFFVADQLNRLEANGGKPAHVESQTAQASTAKAKAQKGKTTEAAGQGAAPAQMDLFDW